MISDQTDKPGPDSAKKGAARHASDQQRKPRKPRRKRVSPPLGVSLMVTIATMAVIAFAAGCEYGVWLWHHSAGSPVVPHLKSGFSLLNVLPFGFAAAVHAFPTTVLLTVGGGYPLFRAWIRRGYLRAGPYVAGGILLALCGAAILAAAHLITGYLHDEAFWIAMAALALYGPLAGLVVWGVLRRSLIELAAETAELAADALARKKPRPSKQPV